MAPFKPTSGESKHMVSTSTERAKCVPREGFWTALSTGYVNNVGKSCLLPKQNRPAGGLTAVHCLGDGPRKPFANSQTFHSKYPKYNFSPWVRKGKSKQQRQKHPDDTNKCRSSNAHNTNSQNTSLRFSTDSLSRVLPNFQQYSHHMSRNSYHL